MHIKALRQLKVTTCGWWDTSGQHCPDILPHEGEAEATVHGGEVDTAEWLLFLTGLKAH